MPSPSVRTREEVRQECVAWAEQVARFADPGDYFGVGLIVADALLAMAECERCRGTGTAKSRKREPGCPPWPETFPCPDCRAGLNQPRLARGLAKLEGM